MYLNATRHIPDEQPETIERISSELADMIKQRAESLGVQVSFVSGKRGLGGFPRPFIHMLFSGPQLKEILLSAHRGEWTLHNQLAADMTHEGEPVRLYIG